MHRIHFPMRDHRLFPWVSTGDRWPRILTIFAILMVTFYSFFSTPSLSPNNFYMPRMWPLIFRGFFKMVLTHFQALHYTILCMEGVYWRIISSLLRADRGLDHHFIAPACHRHMVLPLQEFSQRQHPKCSRYAPSEWGCIPHRSHNTGSFL